MSSPRQNSRGLPELLRVVSPIVMTCSSVAIIEINDSDELTQRSPMSTATGRVHCQTPVGEKRRS
ncbi:MAG: hypothetical protein Q9P90_17215 [candidate division KSB1 bacterium]|nr:hypothetical protein [candidate division KSB1 bacterium]